MNYRSRVPRRIARKSERDWGDILKRSDETVRDIFERHGQRPKPLENQKAQENKDSCPSPSPSDRN